VTDTLLILMIISWAYVHMLPMVRPKVRDEGVYHEQFIALVPIVSLLTILLSIDVIK